MSTIAQQLRAAREAQDLTVQQVAEFTKIRSDFIRALDEGNYDVFSAQVYIRGYVRSYASMLKLDVPRIMEGLKEELNQSEKHHDHPPLSPHTRGAMDAIMYQLSKLNWRVVLPVLAILLVLIISVISFRTYQSVRNRDPLGKLGPGYYTPAKAAGGDTLPVPVPHR